MIENTIYCNLCGKKFDEWDKQEAFSIHRRCGYGTKYDGETIQMDICCECMNKLIEACVISPIENCEDM